jgi:hypothetical protein
MGAVVSRADNQRFYCGFTFASAGGSDGNASPNAPAAVADLARRAIPEPKGAIALKTTKSTAISAVPAALQDEGSLANKSSGVAWRDVALFTLLSYLIAWAIFLPSIPNVFDLLSADHTPSDRDFSLVAVLGMFAPLVAAVVMRLFVSKEGLKGSLGPVRRWRSYGLALVLPAALVSLVIGVDSVTGWATSRGTKRCRCGFNTPLSPLEPSRSSQS